MLDIAVRQQILRLLVKEVLVGSDRITLRHSIPIPQSGPGSNGSPTPPSGVIQSRSSPGYLLRSGSDRTALRRPFHARTHQPVLHHPRIQECSDELQQPFVLYPFGDRTHQIVVVDSIEGAHDILPTFMTFPSA